jgi:hypothetical protein
VWEVLGVVGHCLFVWRRRRDAPTPPTTVSSLPPPAVLVRQFSKAPRHPPQKILAALCYTRPGAKSVLWSLHVDYKVCMLSLCSLSDAASILMRWYHHYLFQFLSNSMVPTAADVEPFSAPRPVRLVAEALHPQQSLVGIRLITKQVTAGEISNFKVISLEALTT